MSSQAFNVVLFVADFVAALDRLQRCSGSRPAYPSVPWHRALREADYADARRLIVARHAELEAVHQRVPAISSPRSKAGVSDCGDETTWCPTLPPAVLSAS